MGKYGGKLLSMSEVFSTLLSILDAKAANDVGAAPRPVPAPAPSKGGSASTSVAVPRADRRSKLSGLGPHAKVGSKP